MDEIMPAHEEVAVGECEASCAMSTGALMAIRDEPQDPSVRRDSPHRLTGELEAGIARSSHLFDSRYEESNS